MTHTQTFSESLLSVHIHRSYLTCIPSCTPETRTLTCHVIQFSCSSHIKLKRNTFQSLFYVFKINFFLYKSKSVMHAQIYEIDWLASEKWRENKGPSHCIPPIYMHGQYRSCLTLSYINNYLNNYSKFVANLDNLNGAFDEK